MGVFSNGFRTMVVTKFFFSIVSSKCDEKNIQDQRNESCGTAFMNLEFTSKIFSDGKRGTLYSQVVLKALIHPIHKFADWCSISRPSTGTLHARDSTRNARKFGTGQVANTSATGNPHKVISEWIQSTHELAGPETLFHSAQQVSYLKDVLL